MSHDRYCVRGNPLGFNVEFIDSGLPIGMHPVATPWPIGPP